MAKLVGAIELLELVCSGRYSTPTWILSHLDGYTTTRRPSDMMLLYTKLSLVVCWV